MKKHVIKYMDRIDERKTHKAWCGKGVEKHDWFFVDAQHVALSACGSIAPCKKCIKAIIRELEKEL